MNFTKLCRICGDEATGLNYGGLSCESCKVFFHRNKQNTAILECRKNGNCTIDRATRRFCAKCRMDKCVALGMNRKSTKNKISDETLCKTVENVLEMNILKYFAAFDQNNVLSQSEQHFCDTIRTCERKKKYAIDLSLYEKERICEVQRANSYFIDENQVPIVRQATCTFDYLNIPNVYFRNTVKFCKNISDFARLNSSDQFEVLKRFCYDFLAIRVAFLFDPIRNGLPIIIDEQCQQAMFIDFGHGTQLENQEAMEFNGKFIVSLNVEMENDSIVRDLLSALLLFLPPKDLSIHEAIRYHYHLYSQLLLRYLQHKYKHVGRAKKKHLTLQRLVNDLSIVKKNQQKLAQTEVDTNSLSDLVLEMYAMKSNE